MWGSFLLAEGLLSIGGFIIFYIWQMRSIKAAEARLAAEREAEEADKTAQ